MGNFMTNAAVWCQKIRQAHCTHEILLGFTKVTASPMRATVSSDDATSTQNRVGLQRQMYHFIIRRCDLEKYNIKIQRGLKLWYLTDVYEIAFENRDLYEYNDPDRLDIILKAVLIQDKEGIAPSYTT